MKNFMMKIFLFLFVVLMVPCIFTFYYTAKAENNIYKDLKKARIIDDLGEEQKGMDIETFVKWSTAGSMPICFHLEALKAQTILSRTNTYKKLERLKKLYPDLVFPVSELELPYISATNLMDRIGVEEMEKYIPVLEEAIKATKGQIIDTNKTILFFPNANRQAEAGNSYTAIISQNIPDAKYKIVKNN